MVKGISKALLVTTVVTTSLTALSVERADAACSDEADVCRPPAPVVVCRDDREEGCERLTRIIMYGEDYAHEGEN